MDILLVMTARQIGGAELYAEHLIAALTAQGRSTEDLCRFTVALSDRPELTPLVARLSGSARIERFPFEQLTKLPGITRGLQHLATQHDVIHINSNHPASRLGILMGFALPGSDRPVVAVEQRATPVSDVQVPHILAWALPTLFRWSRRRVACVVAVSRENERTLIESYGLPANRIEIVYNGVDLNQFFPAASSVTDLRRELGYAEDQPIVLVLARLAANKGHRFLIDAAPAILASYPNARFVFAGAPEERETLERQIAAAGLEHAFAILGLRADVVSLLQGSDVFVLPSLAEGFSLSIAEALAVGLPVIATRVGGASEIIEDGHNGFLVPPADAGALAAAVNRVLSLDAATKARLRQAALQTAERFSFSTTARKMQDIYERVKLTPS